MFRSVVLVSIALFAGACTPTGDSTGDAYVPYVPKNCTPVGTPAACPQGCVELRAPRTSAMTGCCDFDPPDWSTTETAGVGCYDPFASQNNPGTLCYVDATTNVTYGVTAHIQNLRFYPNFSIAQLPVCQ